MCTSRMSCPVSRCRITTASTGSSPLKKGLTSPVATAFAVQESPPFTSGSIRSWVCGAGLAGARQDRAWILVWDTDPEEQGAAPCGLAGVGGESMSTPEDVNRQTQRELYGEPVADIVGRIMSSLGLTQVRLAEVLDSPHRCCRS